MGTKHFKDNMDTKLLPTWDKLTRAKICGNAMDIVLLL